MMGHPVEMDLMENANASSKHLILGFVLAYALVFAGLAAVGYHCLPKSGENIRVSKKEAPIVLTDVAYVDLPPVIVSVEARQGVSTTPRVRVDLALEVARKDREVVEGYQPYITERVGTMLRGLSPEEIESTRNIGWIRSEMLRAVNTAGAPAQVQGVIFRRFVLM